MAIGVLLILLALLAAVEGAYTLHLRRERVRARGEQLKLLAAIQRQAMINLELARKNHHLDQRLTDALTDAAHWRERYDERCSHADRD
jgi:hypothetical protein